MLFLLIMLMTFLLQDNAIISLRLKSLNKKLVFHGLSYVLKHDIFFLLQAGYIFSFLAYKTLKAIVKLFFSDFFQSSFSDGKFIRSQLYLFI